MLNKITGLVRMTLAEPRSAAKYLLKNAPDRSATLELAVAVIASSTILSSLVSPLFGDPGIPLVAALIQNPLLFAVIDFMALMISVIATHIVGRMFGGAGSFDHAFILVVWLQVLMLIFQAAVLLVMAVSPSLANTLTVIANFYLIWLFVNFVMILHRFNSRFKIFLGFIATSVALSFIMIILLTMFGLGG